MKIAIYTLMILLLCSCDNTEKTTASSPTRNLELLPEPDKDLREAYEEKAKSLEALKKICSAVDVLKLKKSELQQAFFIQRDSILKKQYPNNEQATEIMFDLTPKLLSQFLMDINKDSLIQNGQFEKDYHFNIAPPEYSDPKKCMDKISVSFDKKSCQFIIQIFNTFLAEPNWCVESMVIYGFKIDKDKIIDFSRNEAG